MAAENYTYDQYLDMRISKVQCVSFAVPEPPKCPSDKERWVYVNRGCVTPYLNGAIRQPDPNRVALYGLATNHRIPCTLFQWTHITYYYADEIPRAYVLGIVGAVILSVLTTPLILLCCVPMFLKMKGAKFWLREGDIAGARKECGSCVMWCYFAQLWVVIAIAVLVMLAALLPEFA